ncbi:MAG TPA: hybrid sensor histidine kinase/response regulator [Rhodocyclaceae bacterium]
MMAVSGHAASSDLSTAGKDELVLAELVRTAYGGRPAPVPSTAYANVAAALMLYGVFYGVIPAIWLNGWLAVEIAYQGVRVLISREYWRRPPGPDLAPRWARIFARQSFFNGLIWGIGGLVLFSPEAPERQALLAVMLCGLTAGSVPVTAMLRPAFLGTAGTILVPFIARNLVEWDAYHITMAGMLSVFLAFVLSWGRSLNGLLTEAFEQRVENQMLLGLAEQANLAKSKFLAAASHDLRQPLHALTLFAGALLEERDPERVKRLAENIGSSLSALNLLLNSLLDISKLDAGAVEPKAASFPCQEMFDHLFVEFAPLAAEKRLRLRMRPTDAILLTDQVLLERVVRNLLSNAIRYTERGSVLLACRRAAGAWRIEVRDSGCGIAAEKHQAIFGEFVQLGNPERDREKGLGLGLAIVSRVCKLLGCPVGLRSAPGRGSTFSVRVPVGAKVAPHAPARGDMVREGVRVLVIDDEASARESVAALLATWNHESLTAESLDDALERLDGSGWLPDIVLCDLRLRGDEVGTEVLAQLRGRIGPDLPCVLVTGDIAADRLRMVQESGFPVLHKPVSPSRLRAVIGSLALAH